MITFVERFADRLPRGDGSEPASRLALTGKSFRPLLPSQDGPKTFAGARRGWFPGQEPPLPASRALPLLVPAGVWSW